MCCPQRGMLLCFFQGRLCFLLASSSRSSQILRRVSLGEMMSSMKPSERGTLSHPPLLTPSPPHTLTSGSSLVGCAQCVLVLLLKSREVCSRGREGGREGDTELMNQQPASVITPPFGSSVLYRMATAPCGSIYHIIMTIAQF